MRERGTKTLELNFSAIQEVVNQVKRSYIKNYVHKHKEWPPCTIPDTAPSGISCAGLMNVDPESHRIKKSHSPVTIGDYAYIDLLPTMKLDKLDHYAQYLQDKTISLCKSKLVSTVLDEGSTERVDWTETRLLLHYMFHTDAELNLDNYLIDYMSDGEFSPCVLDKLCIKAVAKELELKAPAGRPFGCKTFQDRYRGIVQEKNMARYLEEYVNDQAMTIDHLQLVKRLYSFRKLKDAFPNWTILYINFDVCGWCGNFREETVDTVLSETVDKIFGENLFGKTHKAYQGTFIYMPSATGTWGWVGIDGGIEGLNQSSWMCIYVAQMRYALEMFGFRVMVMAYGDDYKAALLIPPGSKAVDIQKFRGEVVKHTSQVMLESFGQNMKPEDSYGSLVYTSFCKNPAVGNIEMPQGIRKIQKCHGSSNAFLPTLDEYVSSAYSNAHSAATCMTVYYPCYLVALFWTLRHLLERDIYCRETDISLLSHTLIPSNAGGLPIIYLHNYSVCTESDLLPVYVDLVNYIEFKDPGLFAHLVLGLSFDVPLTEDKIGILLDPYSLPITKPPLPTSYLRSLILPTIKRTIRNESIQELIRSSDPEWTTSFVRCLMCRLLTFNQEFYQLSTQHVHKLFWMK